MKHSKKHRPKASPIYDRIRHCAGMKFPRYIVCAR